MKVDGTRALAAFRRYLSDRNLPATHQRLAVAGVVLDAADHLSAEESDSALLAEIEALSEDEAALLLRDGAHG